MIPKIACYRITSKCNYNCACCNGPKNIKDLSLSEVRKLIKRLHSLGFEKIDIIGGEPLIREDFKEIIREFKKYGFFIRLDTSGFNFFKHSDFICDNIDILRMPIDDLRGGFRGIDHLENLRNILLFFKTNKIKELRIGTVIINENLGDLDNIKDFLECYSINSWELYEFLPENNAIKAEQKLNIPHLEFENAIKRLHSEKFKILISRRSLRSRAYFYINPDGLIIMPIEENNMFLDKKIGHIQDKDIIEKWNREINEFNYNDSIKNMF